MISFAQTTLASCIAALILASTGGIAVAKKGVEEVKTELGSSIDDRSRHGRGNGESGRSTDTTSTSGRGGSREGFDRPNGNGSGSGSSNSGTSSSGNGASTLTSSGSSDNLRRRDELDRF